MGTQKELASWIPCSKSDLLRGRMKRSWRSDVKFGCMHEAMIGFNFMSRSEDDFAEEVNGDGKPPHALFKIINYL